MTISFIFTVQKAAEGAALATKQLQELQEHAENNKGKLETVAESLSFLKEKIKEAREKASKVQLKRIADRFSGLTLLF